MTVAMANVAADKVLAREVRSDWPIVLSIPVSSPSGRANGKAGLFSAIIDEPGQFVA